MTSMTPHARINQQLDYLAQYSHSAGPAISLREALDDLLAEHRAEIQAKNDALRNALATVAS